MEPKETTTRTDAFMSNDGKWTPATAGNRTPGEWRDLADALEKELSAAQAGGEWMQYETFGYALAMRVAQSEMYYKLDDKERAECDELIQRGMSPPPADAGIQKAAAQIADGQASGKPLTDNALASEEIGTSAAAAHTRKLIRDQIAADPDVDSDAGIPAAPVSPAQAGGERTSRMNRDSYERMIEMDLEWLTKQPSSLERDHIEVIVRRSAEHEYISPAEVAVGQDTTNAAKGGDAIERSLRATPESSGEHDVTGGAHPEERAMPQAGMPTATPCCQNWASCNYPCAPLASNWREEAARLQDDLAYAISRSAEEIEADRAMTRALAEAPLLERIERLQRELAIQDDANGILTRELAKARRAIRINNELITMQQGQDEKLVALRKADFDRAEAARAKESGDG